MSTTTDYVDVLTAGGTLRVDVQANVENGYLDEDNCETTGMTLESVRRALTNNLSLLTANGFPTLIERSAALAFSYVRVES